MKGNNVFVGKTWTKKGVNWFQGRWRRISRNLICKKKCVEKTEWNTLPYVPCQWASRGGWSPVFWHSPLLWSDHCFFVIFSGLAPKNQALLLTHTPSTPHLPRGGKPPKTCDLTPERRSWQVAPLGAQKWPRIVPMAGGELLRSAKFRKIPQNSAKFAFSEIWRCFFLIKALFWGTKKVNKVPKRT